MVNEEPRWTCQHVERVAHNGKLHIAPLRNLPVIKDLVTDMDPFFDKWVKAEAIHHPSAGRDDEFATVTPEDPERIEASAGIECINCAICYAARHGRRQSGYLGRLLNGRGRSLTTRAMVAAMPSSMRYPGPVAATAVIPWEAVPIIVRTIWIRWAPSPG